jgi:hypothetical protein
MLLLLPAPPPGARAPGGAAARPPRHAALRAKPQHRWALRAADTSSSSWPALTDRMVALSSVPFTVLSLPQAVQNFQNIAAGSSASLQAVSWLAYATALFGNTLMCGHFANRGESSAVGVQLIGIANNLLILGQLAWARAMPAPAFGAVLAVAAVSLLVMRLHGPKPSNSSGNGRIVAGAVAAAQPAWGPFQSWQLAAGCLGLAAVPQTLWWTFYPAQASLLPGAVALAAALVHFARKLRASPAAQAAAEVGARAWPPGAACRSAPRRRAAVLRPAGPTASRAAPWPQVSSLPGWGATLMFALSPLPQLVRRAPGQDAGARRRLPAPGCSAQPPCEQPPPFRQAARAAAACAAAAAPASCPWQQALDPPLAPRPPPRRRCATSRSPAAWRACPWAPCCWRWRAMR